jgi:hypothetical protein
VAVLVRNGGDDRAVIAVARPAPARQVGGCDDDENVAQDAAKSLFMGFPLPA